MQVTLLGEALDILMVLAVCGALLAGFPVAFTLAGIALLFGLLGTALGVFEPAFFRALPQRVYGVMTNEVLIAVPLFVFMGVMLERSKVAEDLLESLGRLFGTLRGGLGIAVCVVGALLAASTGIVGATVVTMGLLSLPTMLRHGYDPRLACGVICAAGTLGQIIPPSIVLVLLGDVMSAAFQRSQLERGLFTPETVAVGDLFAGALLPGLVLVGLYVAYVVLVARLRPAAAPPLPPDAAAAGRSRSAALRQLAGALLAPVVLIVAVLGSILGGIATPTEAAGVGAVGALLLAGWRRAGRARPLVAAGAAALVGLLLLTAFVDLRVTRREVPPADQAGIALAVLLTLLLAAGLAACLLQTWRAGVLAAVVRATARISSMVFVILIGATLFSLVFRGLGGEEMVHAALTDLPGGTWGALALVMLVMFLLGFFLDFIEIVFVVVPLVAPPLLVLGVDPVWLGVLIAVNLQTSFLTPPFGFALFYLRGVAPEGVRTAEIYRGAVPFVAIQLLMLLLLAAWPELATWLPGLLFGS